MEKETTVDLYHGLYEHQKLMLQDIEEFSKSHVAKCLLQDTPTSGGKTYIVPRIMELAKRAGSKLVYMCDTRAHIGAVMDELTDFCKLNHINEDSILLIPSVADGYRRFFDEEYLSDATNRYIAHYPYKGSRGNKPVEPNAMYQLLSFISQVLLISDHGENLDSLRDNAKSAVHECRRYLILMDSNSCDSESREFYSEKFSRQERIIRSFVKIALRSYMIAHKGAFTRDFFNEYSVLKDLYPGTKFEDCDCCVITFAKSDASINFFWAIPSASFTNPGVSNTGTESGEKQYIEQLLHDCWLYIDEADLYVNTLLSKKIESTVKCTVDMYNLTTSILRYVSEKKRFDENGQVFFDIPDRFSSDSLSEKLSGKFRRLDEILSSMKEKFNLGENLSPFFEKIDDSSGRLPQILTTNKNIRVYNLGNYKRAKKTNGKESKINIYLHADQQRQQFLISIEEEGVYELKLEDLCHDCNVAIQHSLGIIRDMSNAYYQKIGEVQREPITLQYAQKAALDMFGFRNENSDPEHNFYINNLYPRKHTSVEADDFYGVGYEIVRLVDSEQHPERTKLRLLKLSQLPDFVIANEVLNYKKVILSSATINMETFQSPHIKWISERVANKMSELSSDTEETPEAIIPSEVVQTMPHQMEIADILRKKQESSYDRTDIVFKKLFPYKGSNEDYDLSKACERYLELTGEYLPTESITDVYQFSRLIHALETVRLLCENKLPFGVHFESALPSNNNDSKVYSVARIKKAVQEMYENHTIVISPENISIISAGASETGQIMDEMLKVGIAAGHCMILFTSYNSNGAGSNLYYCLSDDLSDKKRIKHDIPYLYLGDITNIIPQIQDTDSVYDIDCKQMEATYYLLKNLEIMKSRGEAFNESRIYGILGNIYSGQPIRKDPFWEDLNSVYKASAAAKLYQAFSRADRGQAKSSKVMIAYNADLAAIDRLAIGHAQFTNTSTSYLFDFFLDELDKPVEIHQNTELDEYFDVNNRKNVSIISDLVRKVYEAKLDCRAVSPRIRKQYDQIRNATWSLGFSNSPYNDLLFCYHDDSVMNSNLHIWIPKYTEVDNVESNSEESNRFMQSIVRNNSYGYEASGFYLMASIKEKIFPFIDQVSEFFGSEWMETFKSILEHREDIVTYDFPFLPYAETYYVFLGLLYEKVFLCLCQCGGILSSDEIEISDQLPSTAFEDADFRIAGSHVFFDIKGYSTSNSPSTDEKLREKIKRLGGDDTSIAYIYINTKPVKSDIPHHTELIRTYSDLNNSVVYEVHGLFSENQLVDKSRKQEIVSQLLLTKEFLVRLSLDFKSTD